MFVLWMLYFDIEVIGEQCGLMVCLSYCIGIFVCYQYLVDVVENVFGQCDQIVVVICGQIGIWNFGVVIGLVVMIGK